MGYYAHIFRYILTYLILPRRLGGPPPPARRRRWQDLAEEVEGRAGWGGEEEEGIGEGGHSPISQGYLSRRTGQDTNPEAYQLTATPTPPRDNTVT